MNYSFFFHCCSLKKQNKNAFFSEKVEKIKNLPHLFVYFFSCSTDFEFGMINSKSRQLFL